MLAAGVMASRSKVRVVVGLLGAAREFVSALAELRARGLRPAQVKVVAQAEALGGAIATWWTEGRATAGWIQYRPVCATGPWTVVPAGPDHANPGLGPNEAAPGLGLEEARALLGLRHWPLQRHARQLHLYLENGGALLLVEPDSEAQERMICTALLHHASGGVQTHEIADAHSR